MMAHLEHCSGFEYLAVDTEGFNSTDRFFGISIATPLQSMYFPYNHLDEKPVSDEIKHEIRTVLTSVPYRIMHNAGHDIVMLPYIANLPFVCTMIMAHMVNENWMSKSLEYLHKEVCGGEGKIKDPLMDSIKRTLGWEYIPFPIVNKYAAEDAFITFELFLELRRRYEQEFGPLWSSQSPLGSAQL